MSFTTEESRHVFITAVFKEVKKLAKLRSRDLTSFKEMMEEKIENESSEDIPNFFNVVVEVFTDNDLDFDDEELEKKMVKVARTFAISNFHRFFRDILVGIYVDGESDDGDDDEEPDVPEDVVADIESAIEGYEALDIDNLKALDTYDIVSVVREFARNELDQEHITREDVDRSIPSFYAYLDFDDDEFEDEDDDEEDDDDSSSISLSSEDGDLAAVLDSKIEQIRDLNSEVSDLKHKALAYEQTIKIQRDTFDELNDHNNAMISTLRTLYRNSLDQNIFLKQSILVFVSSLVLAYYNIQK